MERAILSVEQQARVLKSAVEDRWGVKVGARHSVVPWLVEYAAVLLNRMEVGKDGKTAFERCKGRRARTLGIEFGEGVLWKRKPIGGALGKFSCVWDDGVYLGLRGASGELIVSDVTGVWRTRTVQRKAAQDRWRPENVEFVRWVPWAPKEDDPKIDGERFVVTKMTKCEAEREKVEAEQKAPVRFMIKREDLEKHGFSTRCPGCKAILRRTARQGHSEQCRAPEQGRVQRARTEEVSFMKKLGVWEPSSLEECLQMTGRPPVSTRWVDVDKGREGRVEIRSRLRTNMRTSSCRWKQVEELPDCEGGCTGCDKPQVPGRRNTPRGWRRLGSSEGGPRQRFSGIQSLACGWWSGVTTSLFWGDKRT